MWPHDENSPQATEDWIASAARLPLTTDSFRARVLHQSYRAQSQSRSLQRIQTLTSSLLALAFLVCLPGYYQSLRDPLSAQRPLRSLAAWQSPAVRVLPQSVSPTEGRPSDHYEWTLVESALAARDTSARYLRGSL